MVVILSGLPLPGLFQAVYESVILFREQLHPLCIPKKLIRAMHMKRRDPIRHAVPGSVNSSVHSVPGTLRKASITY